MVYQLIDSLYLERIWHSYGERSCITRIHHPCPRGREVYLALRLNKAMVAYSVIAKLNLGIWPTGPSPPCLYAVYPMQ